MSEIESAVYNLTFSVFGTGTQRMQAYTIARRPVFAWPWTVRLVFDSPDAVE